MTINATVKMNLKYFNIEEFDSPDYIGSADLFMDRDFLKMLDTARSYSNGTPFKITSGYRTPEKNAAIYKKLGKPEIKSSHLVGKAADIAIKGSRQRMLILKALVTVGFSRIGVARTFIHVDSDTETKDGNVLWTY